MLQIRYNLPIVDLRPAANEFDNDLSVYTNSILRVKDISLILNLVKYIVYTTLLHKKALINNQ